MRAGSSGGIFATGLPFCFCSIAMAGSKRGRR
jgi:hypothetical protein